MKERNQGRARGRDGDNEKEEEETKMKRKTRRGHHERRTRILKIRLLALSSFPSLLFYFLIYFPLM